MKTAKLFVAAVMAGACAFAQSESAVTKAAGDASTIHASVAALDGVSISAFAAEVIDAIATKPKNPVSKVLSLIEASENLLAESDESNLADVIVAMISNVPFEALPEWTAGMMSPVQEATQDIEDAPYNQLVADVMKKIGTLDDLTDDDRVIVSAFALKLLSRGIKEPDLDPLAFGIAAVPQGYRAQLQSALAAVLAGDYSSVLAGVNIISLPKGEDIPDAGKNEGFESTKGEDSTTLKDLDKDKKEEKKPVKPPVPKPYAEQF